MRLFETTPRRQRIVLDGLWDFAFSASGEMPGEYSSKIAVPGCWDATVEFGMQRGVGFYRRAFNVFRPGFYRLRCEGAAVVSHFCIDGQECAASNFAHIPFKGEAVFLDAGMHSVSACVDNRYHTENCLLKERNGWYGFGGLQREVYLETLSDVFVEYLKVKCLKLEEDVAEGEVEACLRNIGKQEFAGSLNLKCDAGWEKEVYVTILPEASQTVTIPVELKDITAWAPESPVLYFMTAVCGDDEYCERFGLRMIEWQDGIFRLNGSAVKLRGVNHHDYHPESGHTSDLLRMKRDLDLIRDIGFNSIRTSHYPKDQLFLDLCDEMGFLIWEETPGWQNGPDEMKTEQYLQDHLCAIDQMTEAHFNHPCIVCWGMLNEFRSEYEELRPCLEALCNRFRECDSTRPMTYATNRILYSNKEDRFLDMLDIVSPNIYNHWYASYFEEEYRNPTEYIEKQISHYRKNGLAGKPIFIGEFGAGGMLGKHDLHQRRWSEEGQTRMVMDALKLYENNPDVSGYFVWLFSDTACCESEELGRPGAHNCKGLLDEYRVPKMAYYAVREFLTGRSFY